MTIPLTRRAYRDYIAYMITMNLRGVDPDLKRRFRALCMERGKTMTDEMQRLMAEELRRAGKEGKLK